MSKQFKSLVEVTGNRVPKLDQNPNFIKDIIPYDFTKNMGQYAGNIDR